MSEPTFTIEQLWDKADFTPNCAQKSAILHTNGPLYLPAGPGSGKTRVLLWRTVNLIVFHGVPPNAIYLSTFTDKAARQLREGLRFLLGIVSNYSDHPYDTSQMYVGTVHSLCQRLLMDRRFYRDRHRTRPPVLLDDLGQYLHLYRPTAWDSLTQAGGFSADANQAITGLIGGRPTASRHYAVSNAISLFNRLSEECLTPADLQAQVTDPVLSQVVQMYAAYLAGLCPPGAPARTDFSLLQQAALNLLDANPDGCCVFQHVIVDEYQDTNTVQERLFFRLASGSRNLCVVGDDDQALYRFRGATVENFVQFPARCQANLGVAPAAIPLNINYRSRQQIVDFYTDFVVRCDWTNPAGGDFRVTSKQIAPHSADRGVSVVASAKAHPDAVAAEIAALVHQLLTSGKVQNENQIAFLFPSLKSVAVKRMQEALSAYGHEVYAPRAGTFLDVPEAIAMFGLFAEIFGRPVRENYAGEDYRDFHNWLDGAEACGHALLAADSHLAAYVHARRAEIAQALSDDAILSQVVTSQRWDVSAPYDPHTMKRPLSSAARLSDSARRKLVSPNFEKIIVKRIEQNRPFSLNYILASATSLDWNVLDLFYRLSGFNHFRAMFDLAERGQDEGPICNLGLISQYLARFLDQFGSVIGAHRLRDNGMQRTLFASFLFSLYRRGEGEYEDAEDPFPRGRIPFLTIHQAKGLEFPVVVLANPRTAAGRRPQPVEQIVRPFLTRTGEPLDRMVEFDAMRLFYVALSRAQNLLVIAHPTGQGQYINEPFAGMLDDSFPRIADLDLSTVPAATIAKDDTPHSYSYTGDYLFYQRCPRQYMIFKKYGFVPSRSQTMMFGSLVHRTLDDLHQLLISRRSQPT
jgi:DNA helicase-2/ATP-dependent DNA helicase PcrA